jgi:hypothetical protein
MAEHMPKIKLYDKIQIMKFSLIGIRDWYGQYERPISSISLVGGFAFDALTLKRVDLFWENLWVAAHFIIVAILIILINLQENEAMDEKDASKKHFWYINILQFFFGGLLSTFIVFYFRSATLLTTWPFLLILAVAFVANESLKKRYSRLTFQISLFFLSLLAFTIFIVPVIFHRIGWDIFLISGATSLAILFIFLYGLKFLSKEKFLKSKKMLAFSISGIFLATNVLYFSNLIPPIPLSLKEAGIYHSIYRNGAGNYVVETEEKGLFNYFSFHDNFHAKQGDTAYARTAIFSPALFNNNIAHVWQKYDGASGQWAAIYRIDLITTGGRDGGYRTYSYVKNIAPGEWRVNVETSDRKLIGRLRFNVIQVDSEPVLKIEVLD